MLMLPTDAIANNCRCCCFAFLTTATRSGCNAPRLGSWFLRAPGVVTQLACRCDFRLPFASPAVAPRCRDRPDFRSEENTSELQSLLGIPSDVFCLIK